MHLFHLYGKDQYTRYLAGLGAIFLDSKDFNIYFDHKKDSCLWSLIQGLFEITA